jgi:hypothetical protein
MSCVLCLTLLKQTNVHEIWFKNAAGGHLTLNPLMPELNPSVQRCLTRFFYWGFFFLNHAFYYCMPIHNILSTAPQLSISQKALGTLPENGNVVPKHVGATIHN